MKRGMAESTLVVLILVMIIAALLGTFTYKYITKQQERNPEEICRLSIFKSAQFKRITGGEQLTPIDCERTELVIKKKDIVEDDKINQDKASRILAEAMRRCWYMVGEGRMDPFSNWGTEGISYCLICKHIRFDTALRKFIEESSTNVKIAQQRGIGGFIQSPTPYLSENKIPGMEETYWQYLYRSEPRWTQEDLIKITKSVIQEDSLLLITMHKIDEKSKFWQIASAVGGVVLVTAGGILTATGVGAVIGVPLIKVGAGLVAAGVIAYVVFVPIIENAYADCPECNAVGGISLVPPGFDLNQKITAKVQDEKKDVPVCTILVN